MRFHTVAESCSVDRESDGVPDPWAAGGAWRLRGRGAGRSSRARCSRCCCCIATSRSARERLAVALWGEEAPAGAMRTVQVHVSRLRKALGDPEAMATTPAGYRLRVRPRRARRRALRAAAWRRGGGARRRAARAGGGGAARGAGAVAGPAAGGPRVRAVRAPEIARLEEQRLAAMEARFEADLAAGRHAALVSELQQLVAEHPTRERLGGAADARAVSLRPPDRRAGGLPRGRRDLVEAAGVEPGPELQRLHEAVLGQDASLELRPATAICRASSTRGHRRSSGATPSCEAA